MSDEVWAIVDLFGYAKIAGRISEATQYGGTFLRVDVPEIDAPPAIQPAFTRFYGAAAIYSITPVSEAQAYRAAAALCERPITVYIGAPLQPRLLDALTAYDDIDTPDEENEVPF